MFTELRVAETARELCDPLARLLNLSLPVSMISRRCVRRAIGASQEPVRVFRSMQVEGRYGRIKRG